MLPRLSSAAGIVLLAALAVLRVARPPTPVPATAPDTVFSAERAMHQVEAIAAKPHPIGTPEHDRVRDYIVGELTALGVRPQIQRATAVGTRYQDAGQVENILAWLPGSTPNGKAVLLVAHYDGVGAGPAAADDGAGSAALLETMRALRARKQPLAHDVIALFTDGEEAGLLGAAAFVREHRWARDVAFALNFEARGTTGRSFMFETGPGNLDAARALRAAGDATAGSVFTTVYRILPNDTDLSELAVLGIPALNFAFADGVERYHTSRDDLAALNPGSVQHHGTQMLALAKTFGNETLPRPVTGDANFFDLPVIGLIVYPQWLAIPFAVVALVLAGWVAWRARRESIGGIVASIAIVALSGAAAWIVGSRLTGPERWSGTYALGIVLVVVAVTAFVRTVALRWISDAALHAGALVFCAILGLAASIFAPGTGYLLVWPVIFAAGAALFARGRIVAEWVAAALTLLIVGGFAFGASVVMLGVYGVGAIALGALVAIISMILMPQVATILGEPRWTGAIWPALCAIVVFMIGVATVHVNADHPIRSALVYAENADSTDAWLGTVGGASDDWTKLVIGSASPAPAWTSRIEQFASRFVGRKVERVALGAPDATVARDTIINGARRIVLRVTAPRGTTGLVMRAPGAHVMTSSIDGRIVDTTRYRRHFPDWTMQYYAVPDSGAIVALSIPTGAKLDFEVAARVPGLPQIPGTRIPARPASVVPSQDGDVSIVYRRRTF